MIDLGWLAFLAEPWFVIVFYAIGVAGAAAIVWDAYHLNTQLKPAMKWAWPIIVFFFGPVGLALYWFTARPPGIGQVDDAQQKQTAAFWGFAFLGLFLGFVLTYPMNWLLIRAGYKHGHGMEM